MCVEHTMVNIFFMNCVNIRFFSQNRSMFEYSAILNQMVAEVGKTFSENSEREEFLKDYRSD